MRDICSLDPHLLYRLLFTRIKCRPTATALGRCVSTIMCKNAGDHTRLKVSPTRTLLQMVRTGRNESRSTAYALSRDPKLTDNALTSVIPETGSPATGTRATGGRAPKSHTMDTYTDETTSAAGNAASKLREIRQESNEQQKDSRYRPWELH